MNILLLGDDGADGFRAMVEAALRRQCAGLGLMPSLTPCDAEALPEPATLRGRTLVLVFTEAVRSWPEPVESWLGEMLQAGHTVLPVLASAADASGLPQAVKMLNAFQRAHYRRPLRAAGRKPRPARASDADVQGLVDEVLALAWLRRRERRVFISYRRCDSQAIARQLFHAFSLLGYEVFLDDASIPHTADFQRELKWWLNDADLLLALISPNFGSSTWCVEEFSFAQRQGIGALAVRWPQVLYGQGAGVLPFVDPPNVKVAVSPEPGQARHEPTVIGGLTPDQYLQLELADFASRKGRREGGAALAGSELTGAAWQRLLAACNQRRTPAVRARLDNLIKQVPEQFAMPGRAEALRQIELGDFLLRDARGRRCFVRVLPFRPRPEHLHAACDAGRAHPTRLQLAGCLYAENDSGDPRFQAMRWLADASARRRRDRGPQPHLWPMCGGRVLDGMDGADGADTRETPT